MKITKNEFKKLVKSYLLTQYLIRDMHDVLSEQYLDEISEIILECPHEILNSLTTGYSFSDKYDIIDWLMDLNSTRSADGCFNICVEVKPNGTPVYQKFNGEEILDYMYDAFVNPECKM